jgi:uncharacterized OB-fold protein
MRMQIAKPFYEGLEEQKLLLPWCKSCGKPHFYPRSACPHCWSEEDYDWREAKGTGVIHTFTIVRCNPPPVFVPMLPFPIAIIDLDEGVRILSNIVGDYDGVAIGDRVRVEFVARGGESLPMFRRVP